jgi:A/G-specific adenine glycosylase
VSPDFASRLLAWFEVHGRKDLPWQQQPTAYRVWVSEIMLQQTQVNTVIPYYDRFMRRFPSVEALAAANEDDVLHSWTGLGYYARARNLLKAARRIVTEHGGEFPRAPADLEALPGIGRSTAGAIASLAFGRRAVILDGNVKRVIARHRALAGWPGRSAIAKTLWTVAEQLTPEDRVAEYNQAMMDLGATVCTRRNPRCDLCPVSEDCAARRIGEPHAFPGAKLRRSTPVRAVQVLLVRDSAGSLLLEQRPPTGVWGGLWSLPELDHRQDPLEWCHQTLGARGRVRRHLAVRRHTFSHFHLDITPLEVLLNDHDGRVLEGAGWLWYNLEQPTNVGLAAPVVRLIDEITKPATDGETDG